MRCVDWYFNISIINNKKYRTKRFLVYLYWGYFGGDCIYYDGVAPLKRSVKALIALSIAWATFVLLVLNANAISPDLTPTPIPIFVDYKSPLTFNSSNNYTVYSIDQGDNVYLGDHIDISRALAGNPDIAYFGGWEPDASKQPQIIVLPENKVGWYDYYIDPVIFGNMTGQWFKWNGMYESNGNTHAFNVIAKYRNATVTWSNGTVINVSELVTGIHAKPSPIPTPEILPEVHVADYLITQGDALNITVDRTSALWIFCGSDNSVIYANNGSVGEIVLNQTLVQHMMPGRYKILIQSIGNDTPSMDVAYSGNNTIKWFDRSLFEVHSVDLNGMTPDNAITLMEQIFPQTYDTYKEFILYVERPTITIESMDKVGVANAKEYYKLDDRKGNVSLMDVRGYTNVLPGTNISVVLDLDHTTPRDVRFSTFNTTAQGTFLGSKRYYQVFVPLYEDSLYVGMHSLTALTSIGGWVRSDFPVTVMPPDSYQDNVTVKWVGDRNPYIPPVTVTITIPVPGPTQVVIEKVTPSQEEIYAAQKQVSDDAWVATVEYWKQTCIAVVEGVIAIVILVGLFLYGRSVYRRGREPS